MRYIPIGDVRIRILIHEDSVEAIMISQDCHRLQHYSLTHKIIQFQIERRQTNELNEAMARKSKFFSFTATATRPVGVHLLRLLSQSNTGREKVYETHARKQLTQPTSLRSRGRKMEGKRKATLARDRTRGVRQLSRRQPKTAQSPISAMVTALRQKTKLSALNCIGFHRSNSNAHFPQSKFPSLIRIPSCIHVERDLSLLETQLIS